MSDEVIQDPRQTASAYLAEDLVEQAAFGYRTAQRLCIDCSEYHAVWGYLRLAGLVNGIETDTDILEPILARHTPENARILIAGAADAGLLALVARATWAKKPHIVVADRCATPLAICERFADRHGLSLSTVKADLIPTRLAGPYDVIFGHLVLRFIPDAQQVAFLTNLRHALSRDGVLVLLSRIPAGAPQHRNYSHGMTEALAARGIPLPDTQVEFLRRLQTYADLRDLAQGDTADVIRLEQKLDEAGFVIREHIEHDRRRTIPLREGGPARVVPTHVFVASGVGESR